MFTEPLDVLLIFTITTPVIGWLVYKKAYRRIQGVYAALGFSITIYFLYELYQKVVNERIILIVGRLPFYPPLEAFLEIDMLSIFMAFIYTVMGLFAAIYSIRYMEHESGLTEYYTLLLGMVAGMIGVVFAGDFFTLFVFWDLMCLTSYALVAFRKQRWEPIEAGFKYLIMSAVGGTTILFAMSFLYGMTGTLSFAFLASNLNNAVANPWLYVTLMLIIVGFGIKAAIVPFHTWLPDAHAAAPSPISAMLSGVMVETGAYALIRILLLIFSSMQLTWQTTLAFFAVFTMFIGNFMALLQDDLKRLLAFSTIAQVGYILFGLAIASLSGLTASLFHILNHAIMKGLLFLCAGSFLHQTKTQDLRELVGIRQRMPLTSLFFTIGAIAIAAIPPLNGFWSEWMIVAAGIEAGMLPFSALMIVNMIFSVAYYLRIIHIIVLKNPKSTSKKIAEAPLSMLIPTCILASFCIIVGIYPNPFIAVSSKAAQAALNLQVYINSVLR